MSILQVLCTPSKDVWRSVIENGTFFETLLYTQINVLTVIKKSCRCLYFVHFRVETYFQSRGFICVELTPLELHYNQPLIYS
jgi:hypothetical protein